MRRV
jgi:Fe-S cluster biosynthesis and repair protein YggX